MVEFILKYWLEILFTIISSSVAYMLKCCYRCCRWRWPFIYVIIIKERDYEKEKRTYYDCNTKEFLYEKSFDTYSIFNVEYSDGEWSAFLGIELEAQLDIGLTISGGLNVDL